MLRKGIKPLGDASSYRTICLLGTMGKFLKELILQLVWNVMYDDSLPMDLSAGTSIIGFADDALVVCTANDVGILELRVNESLWRTKRCLDSRCLKMAAEKTENCYEIISLLKYVSCVLLTRSGLQSHSSRM